MAPDPSANEEGNPRIPTAPKRDQPLFATRRLGPPLQQPPDFLTDSLNTSHIPSPSPQKSSTRHSLAAKPRQYDASRNKENKHPRPRSDLKEEDSKIPRIVSPSRSHGQHRSRPRVLIRRTPTPPNVLPPNILSPGNSEASPPHGYAEAYQRIVEESNLTDSIDDADLENFEYAQNDAVQERENIRRQRSRSPLSLRTSRRTSPGSKVSVMPTDEMVLPGEIQGGVAEFGPLEDATESSAGSGSSQHARDLRRLNSALKSETKAFSKARLGGSLTVENLRRRNGSNESLGSAFSASGPSGSNSDPSVNIPRQWGRKAKPGTDWLNRVNGRNTRLAGDAPTSSPATRDLTEKKTKPGDEGSPFTNGSSQGSTPRTALQSESPADPKRGWELPDDEFTGRSLQVSESPPIRHAVLDRMREEEIERLEKKAVTTSRLGELHGKVSFGTLRRKALGSHSPQISPPAARSPEVWNGHVERGHTVDEVGEAIPDTPIVIYQRAANEAKGQKPKSFDRQESHGLLKRLARAASDSPKQDGDETPSVVKPKVEQATPLVTGAWIDQTFDQSLQQSPPKTNLKTPKIMGAWIDTPIPTVRKDKPESTAHASTKREEAPQTTQTTSPETVRKVQEPLKYTGPALPKSALEEIIKDVKAGKSLKAAQNSDSEEEHTVMLGNSTIQSLEDLIENDTDLAPTPPSQETSPPSTDPSPSKAKYNDPGKLEAPGAYEGLLSRLTNLGPSLRASKRQIASLERTVSANKALVVNDDDTCHEGGQLHDFIWPCQRCGCPGGSDGRALVPALPSLLTIHNVLSASTTTFSIPIPRLWSWKHGDWRPRLTWLGLAAVTIYVYLFAENWAQEAYCHQLYASSMVGYGVDIHAPEPPFVLFKVLYRGSSLEHIFDSVYLFTRAAVRIFSAIVGYLAGSFTGLGMGGVNATPEQQTPTRLPVSRDTRIPRPQWGPDLSMLEDEFL